MKVHVLGGGPAGLYLSILLKRRDPTTEVVIFERNAADDTFGFGVVFSDETLANIEAADPETFRALSASFARWDSIDLRIGDEVIRSTGHGFCGVSRKRLLELLQERARSLGVVMNFKQEVTDLDTLRAGCDLLVAADGLRSGLRTKYASHFRPSFDVRKCRYIWLGSKQRFEAFTFAFRENEHGLFQIHAYQFAPDSSTVIVECDEETFERAGLARATEAESLAYCERVFAPDLGGHRLVSNRSSWIQFTTVKNEAWSYENVVLMGDAAHTAHFSIGSGTKMAMEDAIALSDALAACPHSIPDALAAYEATQKPTVGRIQTAAQQSLEWFEESKRPFAAFEPLQFAFSLLTRSRRITHQNLKLRDPALIARADAWFAKEAGVSVDGPVPPPMFTPFRLGDLTIENRVVVSPMCMYSAVDGVPNDFHLVHLGSRAQGGAGLLMTEMTNVSAEGRITPGCTGIWNEAQMVAWRRIVDFVHQHSRAKIGLQLGHAGRKGSTKLMWEGMDEGLETGGWTVLGPSAIPYDPKKKSPTPKVMDRADMDRVRDEFVRSTELTLRAGFDLIELHLAHGYLLSSFLTPVSNQRTDEYGGSLENRMRYPLEVVDAVRAAWPRHKPMSVRISAIDWVPEGFSLADAVVLSRALKERGVDVIDVSSGQTSPDSKPVFGRAFQTPFAERIRNEVGIPTIAVGGIPDHDFVNSILLAGRADLVALARPHLADPFFTLHAARDLQVAVPYPPQYAVAQPILKRS